MLQLFNDSGVVITGANYSRERCKSPVKRNFKESVKFHESLIHSLSQFLFP